MFLERMAVEPGESNQHKDQVCALSICVEMIAYIGCDCNGRDTVRRHEYSQRG